jgi:hypothetical protein
MVKSPARTSDEASWEAVSAYISAVGMVAHAWNRLHEKLGQLFVRIVEAPNSKIASAIWYAPFSDRNQRELLAAAIEACNDEFWKRLPRTAKADLKSLLTKINTLGFKRDDAVHAPVLFDDAGTPVIVADFLSGHRRAKNLVGKDLLVEFDYLKRYAEALTDCAEQFTEALSAENAPWPNIPPAPDRKAKKSRR